MKNYSQNIEPTHPSQPIGTAASVAMMAIVLAALVAIVLAIGFGTIEPTSGPRLVCYIGDQVVFEQSVDAASQDGDVITITLAGHTSAVTPPEGGKCYIAH